MPNFFIKPKKIFDILRGKHKKIIFGLILIFVIASLGVFVFEVEGVRAGNWRNPYPASEWEPLGGLIDFSFKVVAKGITYISTFIKAIVSLFFWLSSMILELAFGLEEFTDAAIVEMGWKITRDIANMLFVIGLIIIAGATALNIESYNIKKLLPTLIVTALLINFSLVIAGVIIDFTQVATHFFYDEIEAGYGVSFQIAEILNISKMPQLNVEAELGEKLTAGISGLILLSFSVFLEIILILAASVAIALGAFFLIIRVIILQILLILAPLAWIMSVLPATSHIFKNWWNTFFKWSFFAPIYAFFIYLSVKAVGQGAFVSFINQRMEDIVLASGWVETLGSALMSFPSMFMQFVIIVGFLFGGVIAGQKMGIHGANGVMGIAKGWGKGAGNIAKNWGVRKALRMGAKPSGKIGRGLDDMSNWMRKSRLGRWTKTAALTGQAGRGFRSIEEKERAAVGKEEEKYKGYSGGNLKRLSKSVDARGKIAIANVLAKQKDFKANEELGYTGANIEKTIEIAKRYGLEKGMIGARPDLAASEKQSKKNIKDTIKQSFSFKSEDLTKIQPEAYKIDKKNPEKTPRQEAFRKILLESATAEDGKMSVSVLHKLAETNPTLFFHIKENITQHIASKENEVKMRKNRPDVLDYIESGADKAFSSVNYRRPKEKDTEEKEKPKKRAAGFVS